MRVMRDYNLGHSVTRLHNSICLPVCVLSVFHSTKWTPLSDPEAVSVLQGKDRIAKSAVKAEQAQWKEDRQKGADKQKAP